MAQSRSTKSKSKVNRKTTVKTNKLNIKLVIAVFVVAGLVGGYITYKNIANAGVLNTWSATQFQDMSSGSLVKKSDGRSWWEPGKDANGFAYINSTYPIEYKYCAEVSGDNHKVRIEALSASNVVIGSSSYLYPSEWRLYTGRSAACLNVTGTQVPGRRIGVRYLHSSTNAKENLQVHSITRETK